MIDSHMKKKVLIIVLALALAALCLTGCGAKDNNAPDDVGMADQNTDTQQETLAENDTGDENTKPDDGNLSDASGAASADTDASKDPADDGGGVEILHPVSASKALILSKPLPLNDDYSDAVTVRWNTFYLLEEEALKWPRLAKALKKLSSELDNNAQSAYSNMQEQLQQELRYKQEELGYDPDGEVPQEWYLELDGWPYMLSTEDTTKCNIIRSDSVAFSVKVDYYSYLGGAHPYYAYGGHSFDTQTGHELVVEDVIADMDRLNDILLEKLMTEYEELDLDENDVKETLAQLKSGKYEYAWLLDWDKATFYFNPYMLTSYAGGAQEINLFFAEYPDLFEEKYTKAPKDFVRTLGESGGSLSFDLDGDGTPEEISVIADRVTDDYGNSYHDKISLYLDGREESAELFEGTYLDNMFLVHTKGNTYIYCMATGYESPFWQCFDISDGYIRGIGDAACSGLLNRGWVNDYERRSNDMMYYDSADYVEAFTDPARFRLGYWVYVLGSVGGMKTYYVGEDGLPKTDDKILDVSCSWKDYKSSEDTSYTVYTTETDLTMDVLDEEVRLGEPLGEMGSVKESGVTIPAGTKLTYIRTDEKTFSDFLLEDGRVVRAAIDPGNVDMGDYTQYICGVSLEEALGISGF